MESAIWLGLILGLASNLHCLGMCGPIALATPVNRTSWWTILIDLFKYHSGRIAIYTVMGIFTGMIGNSIRFFGWLQWLSIISGILIILFAWGKYFAKNPIGAKIQAWFFPIIQKIRRNAIQSKSPLKLFVLGMVNGLLPCGVVYLALGNAVLAESYLGSALAMTTFGIGTLPILLAIGFFGGKLGARFKNQWKNVVPVVLTVVGIFIILRGMNLGVPYISPKINKTEVVKENGAVEQETTLDCCHSSSKCEKN